MRGATQKSDEGASGAHKRRSKEDWYELDTQSNSPDRSNVIQATFMARCLLFYPLKKKEKKEKKNTDCHGVSGPNFYLYLA